MPFLSVFPADLVTSETEAVESSEVASLFKKSLEREFSGAERGRLRSGLSVLSFSLRFHGLEKDSRATRGSLSGTG